MLDADLLAAIAAEARQAFLEEDAPECLTALNHGLQELEQVLSSNPEADQRFSLYKNLGRAAHSLKGGAGMAALPTLNHLCHRMEDVFEALEQRKLPETAMVFELLVFATQEVQTLIDLAIAGQEDAHTQTEIALTLESFLNNNQTAEPEPEVSTGISNFVKTALELELEDCLTRVEKALPTGDEALLQERFPVLAEECTLLGQALSCPWLERIIQETQSLQAHHPFIPLITTAIAEIRHQRQQFLTGTTPTFSPSFRELSPQIAPLSPPVPSSPPPPVPQSPPPPVSPAPPLPLSPTRQSFPTCPQSAKPTGSPGTINPDE